MANDELTGLVEVVSAVSVDEQEGTTGFTAAGDFLATTEENTDESVEVKRLTRQPTLQKKKKSPPQPLPPETRIAIRAHWKAAREATEMMLQASNAGDVMALVNAVDDLDMELAKLWELRSARDINWRTILNHTQGMIRELFAQKKVEALTAEQCRHVKDLVDRYLGPATKTTADLNEAVRLIEDAGFDPYAAISGDPIERPDE